jgi:excisionase family DNA binding protein
MTAPRAISARDVLAGLEGKLFADVPEVAELLRSDQRTIRRSIAAGNIPAIRTGQRWRVPVSWLRQAAGL